MASTTGIVRSARNSIKPLPPKRRRLKKGGGGEPVNYSMDGRLRKTEVAEVNLQDMVGEVDFEGLVKYEYMKLHRQYRLMENARLRLVHMGSHVSKQNYLLQQLSDEKEELATDLVNVTAKHWKQVDKKSIKTILDILEFFEKSEVEIAESFNHLHEMTRNVDVIMKSLVDQKLKVQAVFGQYMTVPEADRRKAKLENRLYVHTTKCDSTISENKAIRVEINLMLQLRLVCYETLVAVKKQSTWVRNRMSEIVYLSTQAYDSRDEAMIKIHSLRDKSEKECKQHIMEVKELQRMLTHDTKLRNFMRLKNNERVLGETANQRIERIKSTKMEEMGLLLKAYTKSLKEILKGSQFNDMETLVQNYHEHEQRNFSTFKCITDLNHESTAWREQIMEMQEELEEMYRKRKDDDKAWNMELNVYENMLFDQNNLLDSKNKQWEQAQEEMDQIVHLLDNVFSISESSNAAVIRLLGNHDGITPQNASMCMRVVEGRVAELLYKREELKMRKTVEDSKGVLPSKKGTVTPKSQGVKGFGGPFIPSVMLTGHSAEEEDGDEDDKSLFERPFTYEEMRARILEKLALRTMALAVEESEMVLGDETDLVSRSSKESLLGAWSHTRFDKPSTLAIMDPQPIASGTGRESLTDSL